MTSPLVLELRHHTGFDYAEPVTTSYNEARMTPVSEPGQLVRRSRLHIDPAVAQGRYTDYFGTEVISFEITEPHRRLVVEATSLVERRVSPIEQAVASSVLDLATTQDRFVEYLTPTTRSAIAQEVVDAVKVGASRQDLHQLAEHVAEFVRASMTYLPGATSVSSTAQQAWDRQAGVCQDMTHVTVGLLRSLGVPTRYVSGYLYSEPTVVPGLTISGESHAWIEYWAGEWTGIDPTNGLRESERHVIVARGRDYDDVPPLKGVYDGLGSTRLGVEVEMTAHPS